MEKRINLNQSVYDLCNQHPEMVEILQNLGFTDIVKPGMMQTAGRVMTLPKGAKMKKIDLESIKQTLTDKGFIIEEEK